MPGPFLRGHEHSREALRSRRTPRTSPPFLKGLSVGDAFGGKFFTPPGRDRAVPPPVWRYSDGTEMALAVVEILERLGGVDQRALALSFARRYQADPYRGYGLSVRRVLEDIAGGEPWQVSARSIFEGTGSMGNGSRITAPDTVPFALWCAARHIDDYAEALWAAVSVGGDHDTLCAIVGGTVVLACGPEAIPEEWLTAREPLDWEGGRRV